MKRKYLSFAGVIAVFVVLAGCQDNQLLNPSDTMVSGADVIENGNHAAAPGTVVNGFGLFETAGGEGVWEQTSGPTGGQAECLENGAWRNPAGNITGSIPHDNCSYIEGQGGESLAVEFDVLANLVQAGKSGNINLNFQETEGQNFDDDTYIHYRHRGSNAGSNGEGYIIALDENGNEWIADLSQVNGSGNWFENDPLVLVAVNEEGDEVDLVITFH